MRSRSRKVWLLWAICVAISALVYAEGQAAQVRNDERKPIVIERAPQRVIKDPYPSFSAEELAATPLTAAKRVPERSSSSGWRQTEDLQ